MLDNLTPNDNRRMGIVRITREILLEVLRLPPGTEIIDLSRDAFMCTDEFALKIIHPDLPPAFPGHALPELRPNYSMKSEIVFDGWNGFPYMGKNG